MFLLDTSTSGDFVIVEPIDEGVKVKAEIVAILYPDQIKHLKKRALWCVAMMRYCALSFIHEQAGRV